MTQRIRRHLYAYFEEGELGGLPDSAKGDTIVLDTGFGIVCFHCPCGCGDEIRIPIKEDRKKPKHWRMTRSKDSEGNTTAITLEPSIHRTGDTCKSHFFIRNNHVYWC